MDMKGVSSEGPNMLYFACDFNKLEIVNLLLINNKVSIDDESMKEAEKNKDKKDGQAIFDLLKLAKAFPKKNSVMQPNSGKFNDMKIKTIN